jgi:hypothetical protein
MYKDAEAVTVPVAVMFGSPMLTVDTIAVVPLGTVNAALAAKE